VSRDPILYSPHFNLSRRDLLSEPKQVRLCLDASSLAGFFRDVEVATSASHPTWTLVEEVVRAVPVTKVVKLPWLTGRASAFDYILIDQDFDRSQVAGEVAGILVRPFASSVPGQKMQPGSSGLSTALLAGRRDGMNCRRCGRAEISTVKCSTV
jgi:hypothetical protein